MPDQPQTGLEPAVLPSSESDLSPTLGSKRKPRVRKPPKPPADMTIDELIKVVGDETERYWKLSDKLTVRQSYKVEGRKDLEKLNECLQLWDELLSRPEEDIRKATNLMNHPGPGVRLDAATRLKDYALDEAVETFRELGKRNRAPDGSFVLDQYGSRARGWLKNLAEKGRIPPYEEEPYRPTLYPGH